MTVITFPMASEIRDLATLVRGAVFHSQRAAKIASVPEAQKTSETIGSHAVMLRQSRACAAQKCRPDLPHNPRKASASFLPADQPASDLRGERAIR